MRITQIADNKRQFLDLLLLGDEQENMIDRYLEDGNMFALYDDDLKAVSIVVHIDNNTCELKNIAVYTQYQGQGYGSTLIRHICNHYKERYKAILVGTGESPSILAFYTHCGFEHSHRIENFFTDNYDHPIIEDGIQLVDMIYLIRKL